MEDEQIIDLYFARSETAITETERTYGAYLNQIAYNILRDPEDTVEIVNDTYLGAWNAIPPIRPACLRHFLSRITRNLSFTRLDYRLAGKRNAILEELDECIPDERGNPERCLEIRELGESLNRFLGTLERRTCAVFLARHYYACSVMEIASQYGMTPRQVQYLLSKTRAQLRQYFEREGICI